MEENLERHHIIGNFDKIATSEQRRFSIGLLERVIHELSPDAVIRRRAKDLFSSMPETGIHVFGFGKATARMMAGAESILGRRIVEAAIIVPDDDDVSGLNLKATVLRGTHPITSNLTENSSRKLVEMISNVPAGGTVLFLISGGGSALFEIPEDGFSISDISEIAGCLMKNGSDIVELNCVRNAMSSVKGGKLASRLHERKVTAMYVSDVPYDDLSLVASGPLIQGNYSCDPEKVFSSFPCRDLLGNRKLAKVETGKKVEIENIILLKNYDFVKELCSLIRAKGEHVIDLGSNLRGDVQDYSDSVAQVVRSTYNLLGRGFWFVGGGEPTVKVAGHGKGGRCQEFALRFMKCMRADEQFLLLAAGTDGVDGSSDAMGALVDSGTKDILSDDAISISLENNDSFTLLHSCNSSLISGRTGNNVSDIFLGYYGGQRGGKSQ